MGLEHLITSILLCSTVVQAVPIHSYDSTEPHSQNIISFPVVFRSQRVGVQRIVHTPVKLSVFPKLTFTTWLYLNKYCNIKGNQGCTIVSRIDTNTGVPKTPTLYLSDEGKLVFASELISGPSDLIISGFTIPLRQWVSIQLNIHKLSVYVTVRDRDVNVLGVMSYTFDHMLKLNYGGFDWNIGGDLWYHSIDGIIGMTDIYVNQHVDINKIQWPTQDHAMYKVGNGTTPACEYMRYNLWALITKKRGSKIEFANAAEEEHFEDTMIRVGDQLLYQAYPLLEHGRVIEGYKLLAQAECYKNINATYTKTVIEGPDSSPDGKEFLAGSMFGDVLSDLALAFRHRFDTDSDIPMDCESALVYYDRVALTAHETINNASLHNVWAETVRLSSKQELYDQEGETSTQHKKNVELAVDGDVEAQKRLGAQHLYGSQGRKKDLNKAFSYYKQAADGGDLQAMHEAALMKINGHGTTQDKKEGVEMLMRAAEAGFVASLGGLGWYKSEHEGNLTEALKYYKRGAEAGDKNSIYSLGMVYVRPDCPGGTKYDEALVQFEKAASMGHLAAALEAGSLHKFGMGTIRSCNHAVRYYSWIAIKHDKLARLTRQALDYYFKQQYQESFLSYQLAAEAGCEASQYNAAYITEKENSKTFHPSTSASLYYYGLSALQDNTQAELALKLYNMNLGVFNAEIQEGKHKDDSKMSHSYASVDFRGHVHEIIFEQTDYNISVEYSSVDRMVVGVEIVSVDDNQDTLKVWIQKLIVSEKDTYKKRKRVNMILPKSMLQMRDRESNQLSQLVKIRCWIANIDVWTKNDKDIFKYAKDRGSLEVIGPWTPTRKFEKMTMCLAWWLWILSFSEEKFPQCSTRELWALKGYSFIMNGKRCGIAIVDKEYIAQEDNTVTMSMWFQVARKCNKDTCSLVYRYDNHGNLYSPLITIDEKMKVHVTVYFGKQGRIATFDDPLPLGSWIHIAISIQNTRLVGCIELGPQREKKKCQYWNFNENILYDENNGIWFMGGNYYMPGVTGYFGQLKLGRDTFYPAESILTEISTPLPDDKMWNTKSYHMCQQTF